MKIASKRPRYGTNYNKGYIGFSFRPKSLVSKKIDLHTKFEKKIDIPISHAFIIESESSCIEALAEKGVTRSPLDDRYFNNKRCVVFTRKPKNYNQDMANRIVDKAQKEIGNKFAFNDIVNYALEGNPFLRWLRTQLKIEIDKLGEKNYAQNVENTWICSCLALYSISEEFPNQENILQKKLISPKALFQEDSIFDKWIPQQLAN